MGSRHVTISLRRLPQLERWGFPTRYYFSTPVEPVRNMGVPDTFLFLYAGYPSWKDGVLLGVDFFGGEELSNYVVNNFGTRFVVQLIACSN